MIWRYFTKKAAHLYWAIAMFFMILACIAFFAIRAHNRHANTAPHTQTQQRNGSQQGSSSTHSSSSGTDNKKDSSKQSSSDTANKDTARSPTSSGASSTPSSLTNGGSSSNESTTPSTPSQPVASYPSASNTGPSGCSSYTNYSGSVTITTDGTTLNCITLTGTLYINAHNVTIQNSILTGTDWWGVRYGNTKANATGLKIMHSKLVTVAGQGPDSGGYDYGIAQEATGFMEIAFNDISGYKDGVTANNAYIHDNYIHNLSEFSSAHSQGIYVYAGQQVKIEHNTIINSAPLSQATAAIYIAPDDGHQNDRIVTNNLLGGGAYTIYGGDSTATNIVVTNNKISTQVSGNGGYYGVVAYWQAGNNGNIWSENTWYDGGNSGKTISP